MSHTFRTNSKLWGIQSTARELNAISKWIGSKEFCLINFESDTNLSSSDLEQLYCNAGFPDILPIIIRRRDNLHPYINAMYQLFHVSKTIALFWRAEKFVTIQQSWMLILILAAKFSKKSVCYGYGYDRYTVLANSKPKIHFYWPRLIWAFIENILASVIADLIICTALPDVPLYKALFKHKLAIVPKVNNHMFRQSSYRDRSVDNVSNSIPAFIYSGRLTSDANVKNPDLLVAFFIQLSLHIPIRVVLALSHSEQQDNREISSFISRQKASHNANNINLEVHRMTPVETLSELYQYSDYVISLAIFDYAPKYIQEAVYCGCHALTLKNLKPYRFLRNDQYSILGNALSSPGELVQAFLKIHSRGTLIM